MTRDDINRWEAEIDCCRQRYEALLKTLADSKYLAPPMMLADKQSYELGLLHGAAAEREACATFLERVVDLSHLNKHRVWQKYTADLLANCAAAIRARGEG